MNLPIPRGSGRVMRHSTTRIHPRPDCRRIYAWTTHLRVFERHSRSSQERGGGGRQRGAGGVGVLENNAWVSPVGGMGRGMPAERMGIPAERPAGRGTGEEEGYLLEDVEEDPLQGENPPERLFSSIRPFTGFLAPGPGAGSGTYIRSR